MLAERRQHTGSSNPHHSVFKRHWPPPPSPQWLEIKPEDDERTVLRKKKLIKSYKSKIRFQNMDLQQKEKQGSWQQFLKGKGGKPKAGFMTGKKKSSMVRLDRGTGRVFGMGGQCVAAVGAPYCV